MDAFDGNGYQWISYTLVSAYGGLFDRYWLIEEGDGWLLCVTSDVTTLPTNALIMPNRSGIAAIHFEGDKGRSTPSAALLAYQISSNEFFVAERFLKSSVMFFKSTRLESLPHTSG